MFSISKYLQELLKVKWYFKEIEREYIEEVCNCEFEAKNDYYLLSKIHYTPIDILLGLEDVELIFEKKSDDYKIKILKI